MQFEAKICLLTSFRDTCFIEIMPQYQPPKRGKMEGSFLFSAHSIRLILHHRKEEEKIKDSLVSWHCPVLRLGAAYYRDRWALTHILELL